MASADSNQEINNLLVLLQNRDAVDFDAAQLLEWMEHDSEAVRDWAAFSLGSQTDEDSEPIRKALLNRTRDDDYETRSEAVLGLSRRQDKRALPMLIDALHAESVGMLSVEAAGYFGLPELVAPLETLESWWDTDCEHMSVLLKEALSVCRGERKKAWRFSDKVSANDE